MIDSSDNERPTAVARLHLTLADGLFLLAGVAAVLLRLTNLGRLPLSPTEAEAALGVWRFWQAGEAAIAVPSPAYFSLTALLTQVLGFSDGVMRLVPALAGVALALLPWLLRRRLGDVGALVAAWVLAISPLTTAVSRTASGDSIALFALLLLLVGWLRYQDEGGRWLHVAGGALALGLNSAPLFYGGLLALLLPLLWTERERWPQKEEWRETAVVTLALFTALSTLLLWHLPGVGGAAALLGQWVQLFGFGGGLAALFDPVLALARYEVILLLLGVSALLWAVWREDAPATQAALWLAGLALLLLLQWGNLTLVPLMLLPGSLIIGRLAEGVLVALDDGLTWLFTLALALLGGLMLVNVARFARVIAYSADNLQNIWLALFALAFTAVTIYFFWAWAPKPTYQALILAALLLLSFYQWGTAWWLGHAAANDVRERWVQAPTTDDDLPMLIRLTRQISAQVTGSEKGIDLVSGVDTAVLRWYLREFANASFGQTVPPTTQASLIITTQEAANQADGPAFGSNYFGGDFGLLRTGIAPDSLLTPTPTLDALRWWLFHESRAVVQEQRVVLWIKADLVEKK